MKKRLLFGTALTLGTLLMSIPTFAAGGYWKNEGTGWRYQFTDGSYARLSWLHENDKWYYMDSSGYMYKGWLKDGEDWYYLDPESGDMKEDWTNIGDNWYYFSPILGGRLVTNGYVSGGYYVDAGGAYQPDGKQPKENATGISTKAFEDKVIELVNIERAKYGIPKLSTDSMFRDSANLRAKEIATSFSHTRPDGSSYLYALPPGLGYWGENIAMGQTSPEKVMEAWMNSEVHRANILSKDFITIGVGYFIKDGVIYWVQDFGTRM